MRHGNIVVAKSLINYKLSFATQEYLRLNSLLRKALLFTPTLTEHAIIQAKNSVK